MTPHPAPTRREIEDAPDLIWQLDHLDLTTVGIDIGSATSHVMFARVLLERQGRDFSSRFVVVEREVLHTAPALLTPYVAGERIDADAIGQYVRAGYEAAGLTPDQVDTGVVILTGVALERANARAIAQLFADQGGKFVCASAGHNLEALLAAHGSGAVALSQDTGSAVLNIDVGGGTTKFSAIVDGRVAATMAVNGGGRLVAWDADGRVERIEPTGRAAAAAAGVPVDFGQVLTSAERSAITDLLAERIVVAASGVVDAEHLLAGGLPDGFAPEHILLSGGVAQLVSRVGAGDPGPGYGDLGQDLARSLHARLADLPAAVRVAADAIHATVVGAAQFSVQVSGNTLHVSEARLLPVRNLPVAVVPLGTGFVPAEQVRAAVDAATTRLDLDDYADPVALAVEWDGMPRYATLRALADGIASAHRAAARAKAPLVLAMTSDVAANLGAILQNELAFDVGIVVVDGVEFADLDFIDIGERILPANVVPLLIKSLLFVPREPLTPASQAD